MTAPVPSLRDDLAAILHTCTVACVSYLPERPRCPRAVEASVDADALMPRIEQAILQAEGVAWEAAAQVADGVAAAYVSPHRAGAARHVAQSIRRRAHNPACNPGGQS